MPFTRSPGMARNSILNLDNVMRPHLDILLVFRRPYNSTISTFITVSTYWNRAPYRNFLLYPYKAFLNYSSETSQYTVQKM
jgi:hypothetical protein